MKQLLSLFLFLLPCFVLAQYPSNGNQKITLGEQTSADGLIYRGVLADTGIITPSSDTSAYIILDTVNHRFYNYNRATNVWSVAGGGTSVTTFSGGTTGLTPNTATSGAVTLGGTLAVANGGTGASSFSPNNFLIRTNSSGIFDTASIYEANGNVGVGNASPSFKLDVTGSGRFTGALTASSSITGGAITLTGGTDYGYISDANSFRRIWFENTLNYRTLFDLPFSRSNFAFRDSTGTPKATISSTGVGTFSGVIATSFEVGNGQYYKARRNSSNLLIDLLGIESGTDDTRLLITGDYNIKDCCSTLFKLTSAGAVTIPNLAGINDVGADANGKLQAATSDMNLKNTIENSPFGLNEILLLNPVTFLYNDTNRKIDSDVKEVGFIAQDVFDIIPNAVSSTGTGDLQLDYRAITATLVKAIQEQQALIKALEQRIINLENK
jgi:hypothetical protein